MNPRDSDIPFSESEVAKIRDNLRDGKSPLPCPRCGRPLSPGDVVGGVSTGLYWLYRCTTCRRGVAIGDFK